MPQRLLMSLVLFALATFGCNDKKGNSADAGGSVGSGGGVSSGGASDNGGSDGTGGAAGSGGTSAASGGATGSGGKSGGGGVIGSGGTTTSGGASGTTWWKPTAGTTWQWQIGGGTIDPTLAVQVFDIDWEEDATVVQSLHAASKEVICYVSVGSWEDWRSDAADFPTAVLGNDYPGWPGERFVDIRADALRTIMAKRFDTCKAKGFDALEPDNMDVFEAPSGFPLTRADGVSYALWLADQSHQRGMAIVQKNASSIVADIRKSYDGALTEDCYADNWCADMQPYIDANQPVFACEYTSSIFVAACTWGVPRKYSFILKNQDLGAWAQFCP